MDFKITKVLAGDIFQFTFESLNFSLADQNLIASFGDPLVEFGGDILNGTGQLVDRLPSNKIPLMSGLPYYTQFDSSKYASVSATQSICGFYETTMVARVQSAMSTLRANTNTFNATSVTTI